MSCYVMSNFKIAIGCQKQFTNPRPTFSKGNANPHKMPVTLVALCVFGLSTTPSLYKITGAQAPHRKGHQGQAGIAKEGPSCLGLHCLLKCWSWDYFFQMFSNVLEGLKLCHNVMLCHEQLKNCYEVSRTFHKS